MTRSGSWVRHLKDGSQKLNVRRVEQMAKPKHFALSKHLSPEELKSTHIALIVLIIVEAVMKADPHTEAGRSLEALARMERAVACVHEYYRRVEKIFQTTAPVDNFLAMEKVLHGAIRDPPKSIASLVKTIRLPG